LLNRLRLPCETVSRRRETDLSSPLRKHEVNLANITVLIADQNDGGRRILYELLHAIGSRDLHSVANFKLAQQFLKTEPIDLFICDMNGGWRQERRDAHQAVAQHG